MIEPQVTLLSQPAVDWKTYFQSAQKLADNNIPVALDAASLPAYSLPYYLGSLGLFVDPGQKVSAVLNDPGYLLYHLYFSFLVIGEYSLGVSIQSETDLKVLIPDNGPLMIVSGNLNDWRVGVINSCSPVSSYELRQCMDKCMLKFETLGLGRIWAKYNKVEMIDATFKLVPQ